MGDMYCNFDDDSLKVICTELRQISETLDLVSEKLVDSVVDRNSKQAKIHFLTMVVTIGLLGGIQVFNSYHERGQLERFKNDMAKEMAELPAGGSTKP